MKISVSDHHQHTPRRNREGITHDIEASDTLIRGRSKSSLSRELSSFRRRSFRSAMDCFLFLTSPPARIS